MKLLATGFETNG